MSVRELLERALAAAMAYGAVNGAEFSDEQISWARSVLGNPAAAPFGTTLRSQINDAIAAVGGPVPK